MPHVMTLNAGSSSVKFALFEIGRGTPREEPVMLASGNASAQGGAYHLKVADRHGRVSHDESWRDDEAIFHTHALERILAWQQAAFPEAEIAAAGHRIVHGGPRYSEPAIVTDAVLEALKALIPLAPLHQPHNVKGIEAARQAWPDVCQIACFDTAFHRSHPYLNDIYALPRSLYAEGVRRYGFHGLSYEYVAGKLASLAPERAKGRVIVAHLGNGASICGLIEGKSVSSSMGFTPLDGLAMGTRCGQLDPGVVLYLMQAKGMSAEDIAAMLYEHSGLKGLSGLSNDMRELEAAGTQEATEAIGYFVARLCRETGALAAELGGLDALVFCGGIGENDWRIRERVLERMEWLGVDLDKTANRAGETVISRPSSRVSVYVIPTNEEAMIARHTMAAVAANAG